MLRRLVVTVAIVASIIIIFSFFVTQKREERRELEVKQSRLVKRVEKLRKETEALKMENKALVNDPVQIEREARDRLGYTKPGEITYEKLRFNVSEPESENTEGFEPSGGLEAFLFEGPFPWQVPLGLILIATLFLFFTYKYEC